MSQYLHGPTPANDPIDDVYWAVIINTPPAGSSWQRDRETPIPLIGMQTMQALEETYFDLQTKTVRIKKTPFRLTVIGSVHIEYSQNVREPFPGSYGYPGFETGANVVDIASGPTPVAVGAAATLIAPANPDRVKGVSIRNVGLTTIAISIDPGLTSALVKAVDILAPDSAANAGNGGTTVISGWSGDVYAVNIAGAGAGSVLVGAF